jgi:hypothetical protein
MRTVTEIACIAIVYHIYSQYAYDNSKYAFEQLHINMNQHFGADQ